MVYNIENNDLYGQGFAVSAAADANLFIIQRTGIEPLLLDGYKTLFVRPELHQVLLNSVAAYQYDIPLIVYPDGTPYSHDYKRMKIDKEVTPETFQSIDSQDCSLYHYDERVLFVSEPLKRELETSIPDKLLYWPGFSNFGG